MVHHPKGLQRALDDLVVSPAGNASYAPFDPRSAMSERLPQALQPFLTWLTARPAAGEPIRERSPIYFVFVAVAQTLLGIFLCGLAMHLTALAAVPLILLGWTIACAGLGLFQVVVFHHCSHGTVFKDAAMNVRVGRWISAVLMFKHFDTYKHEHMLHHNHKKLLTDEDEFAGFVFGVCELEAGLPVRELWRRVLVNCISPRFHLRFLRRRVVAAWVSPDRTHNMTGIGVWLVSAATCVATGQGVGFLLGWVLPVTVLLQIATVFRILCEHRFPDPEMILDRGRDFASHATAGVFPGSAPPDMTARSVRGLARWTAWWADMLTWQLFVRLFVLVGDAPCHDYHHRKPASRRWTSYIQARQIDLETGNAGRPAHYQESWGLMRAVDENLASLSRTPRGLVG